MECAAHIKFLLKIDLCCFIFRKENRGQGLQNYRFSCTCLLLAIRLNNNSKAIFSSLEKMAFFFPFRENIQSFRESENY